MKTLTAKFYFDFFANKFTKYQRKALEAQAGHYTYVKDYLKIYYIHVSET